MARALTFCASAWLALLLFGCGKPPELAATPTPIPSVDPAVAAADLEFHARTLSASSNGALQFRHVDTSMASFKVNPNDPFTMSTYRVVLNSNRPEFSLVDSQTQGDEGFKTNIARSKAWASLFCTPNLRVVQQRLGIDFVYGQVLPPSEPDVPATERMSAQCSKEP